MINVFSYSPRCKELCYKNLFNNFYENKVNLSNVNFSLERAMAVKNTFYDSVGGIASGEGLVHIWEMTQRKDFNQDKKTPEFEVSERVTVTINTFLRMHQAMGRVVAQLEEKGVIKFEKLQQTSKIAFRE